MSWEEYWEEYKKIDRAYTKQELPKNYRIIFGKAVNGYNFSKKFTDNKSKQVLVKMIANMGAEHTKNSLDYSIRKSINNLAINEKGEEVTLKEILKDWSKTYSTRENAKEAWHLVFSIDENYLSLKGLKALKESVKDTMDSNFFGHKYAMVLHTHQSKPHIHIVLNKHNLENKKLHFKNKDEIKVFFQNIRDDFSYALKARGLNYENKNSLEKDLEKSYKKLKHPEEILEADTSYSVQTMFQENEQSFEKKFNLKKERFITLQNQYEEMKKNRLELEQLLEQYIRNKNKKMFKLFKEIKEQGKELRLKANELGREAKNLYNMHYEFEAFKEKHKELYKNRFESVVSKRKFIQTYERFYPNHKGATKKEMQNYYRVKKSLAQQEKLAEKTLKTYSQNFYKELFFENTTLFQLQKQYKTLDENIYLLNTADFFLKEKSEPYIKQLEKNKEFIKKLSQKRFEKIEKIVLAKKQIGKETFLIKEYNKGCEFLNKESKLKKAVIDTYKPHYKPQGVAQAKTKSLYDKIQEQYKEDIKKSRGGLDKS